FRLSAWYSDQASVARSCARTASLVEFSARPPSSVSRLPETAASTASTATEIATREMNGSPACAACWACSVCSCACSAESCAISPPSRLLRAAAQESLGNGGVHGDAVRHGRLVHHHPIGVA